LDAFILRTVARWRVARTQAALVWAEADQKDLYGNSGGPDHDHFDRLSEPLQKMEAALGMLSGNDFKPEGIAAAHAMLGVALEILAHREFAPEVALSQGPVLEIIRNVRDGMGLRSFYGWSGKNPPTDEAAA
jgi:hypothetical protein